MKVKALHQIEVTSRCNLRCHYCPSPNLKRPKVDMTADDFKAALEHATRFYRAETQFELNLAGIGESTLHPLFPEFVALARAALPAARLIFATNGVDLSILHEIHPKRALAEPGERMRRLVSALQAAQKTGEVVVFVSMHRPELAGLAHEVLSQALGPQWVGASLDPSTNADDWAGQVKWKRTYRGELVCQWIRDGKVMAMADGRITTCCLDASGAGVIGHVSGRAEDWNSAPYSLCKTCQQKLPEGVRMLA